MPCCHLPAVRRLPNKNVLKQALLYLAIALPFYCLSLFVILLKLLLPDPTCLAQMLVANGNGNMAPARDRQSNPEMLGRCHCHCPRQLVFDPRFVLVASK